MTDRPVVKRVGDRPTTTMRRRRETTNERTKEGRKEGMVMIRVKGYGSRRRVSGVALATVVAPPWWRARRLSPRGNPSLRRGAT